jgi:Tfp pilus assembly protein PilZ
VVTLALEDRRDLLARFYPNGRAGGLTVDGSCSFAVGDKVALTLVVRKPPRTFALEGHVGWARRKGSTQLAVCWGFDLGVDDVAARRVLAWARAEVAEAALRHEARVAVQLPARIEADGVVRPATLFDVSHCGAFVRIWSPQPVGTRVWLGVRPPRSLFATRVRARIAWVRHAGAESGMGLLFDEEHRSVWAQLLKKCGVSAQAPT